jgi:rhamnosyltransferase
MKLASVTVLYNSSVDDLLPNISSYADMVDLLILWDNSPNPIDLRNLIARWPKSIFVQEGKNVGLGEAYNCAIEIAHQHGCTHLMTMDQDTAFLDFAKFRQWTESQPDNILHCQVGGYHNTREEIELMTIWCQSATIFPLAMFDKIGFFRADYFIGMIDAEIGLRAAHNGYDVMQYNGTDALHNVNPPQTHKLLDHTFYLYNYPPFRHYYESRNRILIAKEYPEDFDSHYIQGFLLARLRLIFKVILFEKNRLRKVFAIVSGTYQGLCGKTKPYK